MKFFSAIKKALSKPITIGGAEPESKPPADMTGIARDPSNLSVIGGLGVSELGALAEVGLDIVGLCGENGVFYSQATVDEFSGKRYLAERYLLTQIFAGDEALRCYEDAYIPAARHKCEASHSPRDDIYLANLEKCKEALSKRLELMRDVQEKTVRAMWHLRRIAGDPDAPRPDLSELASVFRAATQAGQTKSAATEKAVVVATVLQKPIEIGTPLKFKAKKAAPPAKPGP